MADTYYEVRSADHEHDEDGRTIGWGDTALDAIADAEENTCRFVPWLVEITDHETQLPGVRISWPMEHTVATRSTDGTWDLSEIYG